MTQGGTAGPAVRMWARCELGRRWKALVALGIIAGIAAGLSLAAIAGARRTSTAYGRWRNATLAPDAIVFGTQVGKNDTDYTPVLRLPEVVAGGMFELAQVGIKEHRLGSLPPGDDQLYRTVSRPLLVHGRLPDPTRQDQIVVNRTAASRYHLRVGDRLTMTSALDRNAFYGQAPDDTGPSVRVTVVGIGDSMMDEVFIPTEPGFFPSGAFLTQNPQIGRAPNLLVRLKPGTNVAAFHQRADAALNLPDIPVRDMAQDAKRFTHGTDLEKTGLWLFAAAVALAAIVLVGQALTRSVYAMAEPAPALRALGFTHVNLVGGLLLPVTVSAVTAGVVAVGSAYALSARFPVGLARRLDPALGSHFDWPVLGPGAAAIALLVLAAAVYAGWRAAMASGQPLASTAGSPVLSRLRNVLPLPVALGAGLALQSGSGKRAVPVRPAIAGAVAGVLGIVGALGLVRGIDDAIHTPSRSGQVYDASVWPDDTHPAESVIASLRKDRDVATATHLSLAPLNVDGAGLPVYSLEPVKSYTPFVVLSGRAPRGPDEVALGPATVKALHKHIGDTVHIAGDLGPPTPMRVVGTTLLEQTPHASFDQGVWVSAPGFSRLKDISDNESDYQQVIAVTGRSGLKPPALISHLEKSLGGLEVDAEGQPQDVLLLHNVRTLPQALAAFLVVLGVAAVGHALVTTVRRRRHDLAVLRAIGLRPRQSAAAILWQAMTVALVALVLGIPLGVIVGRLSWRWVANSTPLLYVAPIAALAIVVAIPAAITLANMLAAYPATRAAGVRPAEVLRTE
jgi:ABC-type lipoprotein release transport system permease subunit